MPLIVGVALLVMPPLSGVEIVAVGAVIVPVSALLPPLELTSPVPVGPEPQFV